MACPALEFHPSRVRAAPGSSPCSDCHSGWHSLCLAPAGHDMEHNKSSGLWSCIKQRYQEKTLLKMRVFIFTSLHPMMWSGVSRALDLTAGKALVGHQDNFPPSQRMILLAEYLLYCAGF